MPVQTHPLISHALCGAPGELRPGFATAHLTVTSEMSVDERGLIHGGFVFGLADHAAMLAVNDPNVVLGSADVKFLAPLVVGDAVVARATVESEAGKKRIVKVEVLRGETPVMAGTLTCFVLEKHVLDR